MLTGGRSRRRVGIVVRQLGAAPAGAHQRLRSGRDPDDAIACSQEKVSARVEEIAGCRAGVLRVLPMNRPGMGVASMLLCFQA